MSVRLVTLALCLLAAPSPAVATDNLTARLAECARIGSGEARLTCYDRLQQDLTAPVQRFSGAGSAVMGPFDLPAGTDLQFESDDAIMVLYLLDDAGTVLRNLHRAGAGGGSHLIDDAGRYRLQVNASGGWRISLVPPHIP